MSSETDKQNNGNVLNKHTVKLVHSLSDLKNGESADHPPVLLLLRHAERRHIDAHEGPAPHVGINERGERASFELGEVFKQISTPLFPAKVLSSPFPRCQQTLEHILKGAEWQNVEVEVKNELFGQGCFMYDRAMVIETFQKVGCVQKLVSMYSCGEQFPGLHPMEQGVSSFLKLLVSELVSAEKAAAATVENQNRKLVLAVSHDFNLAAFVAHFFGIRQFDDELWPGFLEAVAIVPNKSSAEFRIQWRDREVRVPMNGTANDWI